MSHTFLRHIIQVIPIVVALAMVVGRSSFAAVSGAGVSVLLRTGSALRLAARVGTSLLFGVLQLAGVIFSFGM